MPGDSCRGITVVFRCICCGTSCGQLHSEASGGSLETSPVDRQPRMPHVVASVSVIRLFRAESFRTTYILLTSGSLHGTEIDQRTIRLHRSMLSPVPNHRATLTRHDHLKQRPSIATHWGG